MERVRERVGGVGTLMDVKASEKVWIALSDRLVA